MKTIVITGASRGLGRALALSYAMPHTRLILIARHQTALKEVADQCREQGAVVEHAAIDVSDRSAMHEWLTRIQQQYPVDMIIANAGIATTLRPHWQPEIPEEMAEALNINIQGVFNTINPLLPAMIHRKSGQIAMVSSIAGLRGLPQSPSYCASKAAILTYGDAMRAWLKPYGIRVNVICPGYVKTDMSDQLKGPKPFLISPDTAAKKIVRGLARNQACIIFPKVLGLCMTFSRCLPKALVHFILRQVESYQEA